MLVAPAFGSKNDSLCDLLQKGVRRNVSGTSAGESVQKRFASKAAAGKTKNGRDSAPKYLGLKKASGQFCEPGNILIRQRGNKFYPGANVGQGKDHTLFALEPGYMVFTKEEVARDEARRSRRHYFRQLIHIVTDNPHANLKQDIR